MMAPRCREGIGVPRCGSRNAALVCTGAGARHAAGVGRLDHEAVAHEPGAAPWHDPTLPRQQSRGGEDPGNPRVEPSLAWQGAGITIIDSCTALRAALEAAPELREWVVQRYIDRPLLVDGRKFHIRAYALCVGKVRVRSRITFVLFLRHV